MAQAPPASTSVRFSPAVREALKRAAADDARSVNSLLELIAREWLAQRGYLKPPPPPRPTAAARTTTRRGKR
jgi:hypothetical protein